MVDFSLSNAISIAKLNIDTDFQQAAMSHFNYNFQLIVDLTLIVTRAVLISPYSASEGNRNLSSASDKLIMFSLTIIDISNSNQIKLIKLNSLDGLHELIELNGLLGYSKLTELSGLVGHNGLIGLIKLFKLIGFVGTQLIVVTSNIKKQFTQQIIFCE